MSDSGSGLPPAGWYDDPEQSGQHRYWDGTKWTDQRRPAGGGATPPPAPGAPAAPAAPGAPNAGGSSWPSASDAPAGGGFGSSPSAYGSTGAAPVGSKPDPWLWQSIVATLLCCLPLGIAGIVFAVQSQSAWTAGNATEAREKADKAKLFTLISVGIGILVILVFVATGFSGRAGGF